MKGTWHYKRKRLRHIEFSRQILVRPTTSKTDHIMHEVRSTLKCNHTFIHHKRDEIHIAKQQHSNYPENACQHQKHIFSQTNCANTNNVSGRQPVLGLHLCIYLSCLYLHGLYLSLACPSACLWTSACLWHYKFEFPK